MTSAGPSAGPLVFVGERRSRRARELNASWTRGGLAANTLHAALRACGIEPGTVAFLNLFPEGDATLIVDPDVVADVRKLASDGVRVVALGRNVQRTLARSGIAFLSLTHPAARGRIRTRTIYQTHVADVLARAM